MAEQSKRVPKLESIADYPQWEPRARNALILDGYWDVVNSAPITSVEKGLMAKAALIMMVGDKFLQEIDQCATSAAGWAYLKKIHSENQKGHQLLYDAQIRSLKKGNDERVEDYVKRTIQLRTKLKDSGFDYPENITVKLMLDGLPPSFQHFVQQYTATGSLDKLTFDGILPLLVTEEARQASEITQERVGALVGRMHATDNVNRQRWQPGTQPTQQEGCWKCGAPDHIKRNCPQLYQNQGGNPRPHFGGGGRHPNKFGLFAAALSATTEVCGIKGVPQWYIDSACGLHLTGCKEDLDDYVRVDDGPQIQALKGASLKAEGYGSVKLLTNVDGSEYTLEVEQVWYVPGADFRLISASELDKKGYSMEIRDGQLNLYVTVKVPERMIRFLGVRPYGHRFLNPLALNKPLVHRMRIATASLVAGGTYLLDATCPKYNRALAVMKDSVELWHRRFGHLGYRGLEQLASEGMVDGLPVTAKQFKEAARHSIVASHASRATRACIAPIIKSHLDLPLSEFILTCVKMPHFSLGGARYAVRFLDEFSSFSVVRTVNSKDQVAQVVKDALLLLENQTGRRVREIVSDRGREYVNVKLRAFFAERGIRHNISAPYTPEQNGRAERLNRTLLEKVRAMLQESGLGNEFWAEAFRTANAVRNCSPVSNKNATPHELLFGYKPDVSVLRVFGCTAWVYEERQHRTKLDPVSRKGIFVGYDSMDNYRIYLPEDGKVVVSCNVKFDESKGGSVVNVHAKDDGKSVSASSVSDTRKLLEDADQDEDAVGLADDAGDETAEDAGDESAEDAGEQVADADAPAGEISNPPVASTSGLRRSTRDRKAPERLIAAAAILSPNPTSFQEAIKSPQADMWWEAMEEEIASLHRLGTWRLEHPPPDANVVPGRWVYKVKSGADGEVERYKARFVAKGYMQVEGVDYDEVFAPTSNHATVRAFSPKAAAKGIEVHHLDVRTAFLHGDLDEVVYVDQPEGFVTGERGLKCRLLKALYGLRQASRAWYVKLVNKLREMGYTVSDADPGLFIKCQGTDVVELLIHVDDLLIGSDSKDLIAQSRRTGEGFDCVIRRGLVLFWDGGMRDKPPGPLKISQKKYAAELVARFDMADAKSAAIPMEPSLVLRREPVDEELLLDASKFRSLVGGLMYLAVCTRPDIAQAVYKLARFMSKPAVISHWEAAKSVLRYVKSTLAYGIVFCGSQSLVGYADSDWPSDPDSRRSTGYVFILNGGAISWKSRLQPTVAASSVEAEYMAAASATREAVWLRKLMRDLGYEVRAVEIKDDSQGAIALIRNPITSERSKHIDVIHHFVREKESSGSVSFQYCPSHDMVADVLTKPLALVKFSKFRECMGVR
uniref:Reverse transcriptase, gag, polyprotein n=1 Tax=Volvox carteri f. nagariensis TaxID=3068 RepID=O04013_VOLCA|nr:reverse transcriptase, gag, polyprotein [Volvox carteri f. nagariensis]